MFLVLLNGIQHVGTTISKAMLCKPLDQFSYLCCKPDSYETETSKQGRQHNTEIDKIIQGLLGSLEDLPREDTALW